MEEFTNAEMRSLQLSKGGMKYELILLPVNYVKSTKRRFSAARLRTFSITEIRRKQAQAALRRLHQRNTRIPFQHSNHIAKVRENRRKSISDFRSALKIENEQKMSNSVTNRENRRKSLQVKERTEVQRNVNCLPEDVFIRIFRYLDFEEHCRIGRVCKKWYEVSRHPVFWKRIRIDLSRHRYSMSTSAINLVNILPWCVVYMELHFDNIPNKWLLDFTEFCRIIRTRCPNLQALILHHFGLTSSCKSNVFKQLPENLRVLVLHYSELNVGVVSKYVDSDVSMLQVLDLSHCTKTYPYIFSQMPHLKKLRLAGFKLKDDLLQSIILGIIDNLETLDLEDTLADYATFRTIWTKGFYLTELYMCNTFLSKFPLEIIDTETALQNLKILCLRNCGIKERHIIALLESCPSLLHVYLGNFDTEEASDSEYHSEKVKIINGVKYCYHSAKIDYMYE